MNCTKKLILKLKKNMKKIDSVSKFLIIALLYLISIFTFTVSGQELKTIETDIFKVVYVEKYQQPLLIWYNVKCPFGDADRAGLDFYEVEGIITSNDDDYKDNVWDKGHLAPAADFNCDRETLKKTFSYLNCVLQHKGLNRGPWKELERFERDLAKVYFPEKVKVKIEVLFQEENWLPTGALVPSGFKKTITTPQNEWVFEFPNKDVSGKDWSNFEIK